MIDTNRQAAPLLWRRICRRLWQRLRLSFWLFLSCCTLLPLAGHAAQADRIEDLLQARWFDIEIIIFERLDVLDVNTSEALTLTSGRTWPHNLLEFYDFEPSQNPLTLASPFCFGFIEPIAEDELFSIEQDPLASEENLEQLDAVELDDQTDVAQEEALDEFLPQETPQNAPKLSITPYLKLLADIAEFERDLHASSFRWLPDLTLVNQVKALNRQNNLRPLLHGRWRQPVPERDSPQPIYLSSGSDATSPLTQQGFAKLEGHVAVTVGRYLHFAPTLWYHADNLGFSPIALPVESHELVTSENQGYMQLQESRRLRSGDLHYLDHPKLGIIVRIDPIEIPQPLRDTWQSLDAVE